MQAQVMQVGDYQVYPERPLGEGSVGRVMLGRYRNGPLVAIKQVCMQNINEELMKQIKNEFQNMEELCSAYVVKMFGMQVASSVSTIYLFLQYCQDGNLQHYIRAKPRGMCEAEALLFLRDITRGYSALLSKKIIHRDIKPGNILLNKGVAKLGDFGYSRVITDPNTSEKLTLLGSPNYAAPEMFAGKDYCSKCDVWSLGIVLYEMLHGNRPWVAEDKPQLYQAILSQPLKFKPGLNPKIAHLLARMLVIESKQRISWDQLFKYPLLIRLQSDASTFEQYLSRNSFKPYLRLSSSEAQFSISDSSEEKQIIHNYILQITHSRNCAFFSSYVLSRYYHYHSELPKGLNNCLQLQYALLRRTYLLLAELAQECCSKAKNQPQRWGIFERSCEYRELWGLIEKDSNTVHTKCKQLYEKSKQKGMSAESALKNLKKEFRETFKKVLKDSCEQLEAGQNRACSLLYEYLAQLVNPGKMNNLKSNPRFDLGMFYEQQELAFNLS